MRQLARLLPLLVVLGGAPARAANDSIVTLGLGTHTLMSRLSAANTGDPTSTMGGLGFSARLRLLWVLGAEVSYDMTNAPSVELVNVPKPVYQLSAVIYLYAGQKASLFVLAGLGATSPGDLFTFSGDTTSYHGGAGLEIGVTRHWIIAADARINLPGYSQVMGRLVAAGPENVIAKGTGVVSDYYNLDSFQVNLGVRYYL